MIPCGSDDEKGGRGEHDSFLRLAETHLTNQEEGVTKGLSR